jgi:hypothetical protein
MSIARKLKWKRALSTLRYAYEELQYVEEASKVGALEFESFYRQFCAERGISIADLDAKNKSKIEELYGRNEITDGDTEDEPDIDSTDNVSIVVHDQKTPQASEEEYQMTADDIAMHDAFSKLFKRIALKLHPDRIDKNLPPEEIKSRISMFQKANHAFDDKKYYTLLDIAETFNVSTPRNYDLQTRWMKRETNVTLQEVNSLKNKYNFSFAEAETTEAKEALIKKFIFQLFKITVD